VQTLKRATALLEGAGSHEGLAELLRQLGFSEPSLPLDAVAANALHLPATIRAASITQGAGSIRGLVVDLPDDADLRQTLTALANALARTSPQFLWIVIANRAREVAIVCWSSSASRGRGLIVDLIGCGIGRQHEVRRDSS
jgi:hypothetical protein